MDQRILLPPASPSEVLAMIEFGEAMDARMRQLRDDGALPRSAMTLPDEFDDLIVEMNDRLRRQALAALERGEEVVHGWHPRTQRIEQLVAWIRPRMGLMEGIIKAGLVHAEWEGPLRLLQRFWQDTVRQVDEPVISEGSASR